MAAVAVSQLRVQYNKAGKKRIFRTDNEDNLYLYYQDKAEKVVIRDRLESDAENWVKAIMRTEKLTPKQAKKFVETFKKDLRNRQEEDLEYTLIITNVSGKILGTIDVGPIKGKEEFFEAQLYIRLRDQNTINLMAEAIIRALQNLHQNYGWYDKIFLRHPDGELEDLTD